MPRLAPLLALLGIGALWGLGAPLTKIAVDGGYRAFGIIQWQAMLNILVLGGICLWQRRPLPMGQGHRRLYLVVGLFGIALPHSASYSAAAYLPAGVISVIVSLVPLFALPVALALRLERFRPLRGLGLLLGAGAMVVLAAPQITLPEGGVWPFMLVAALGPLFYALEGAFVAGFAVRSASALQTLLGASVVALLVVTPAAIWSGQVIAPPVHWGPAELAVLGGAAFSLAAYTAYVWLLRQAGSVFAAQVAYLVTGFGVFWAMLILGERYGSSFWIALALLFCGLFLVQPRSNEADRAALSQKQCLPRGRHGA